MAIQSPVTYTFTFDLHNGLLGWVPHSGGNATLQQNPIDGGGCLEASNSATGTEDSYWEWTGTWEDLGVPPGSELYNAGIPGLGVQLGNCDTKVASWYDNSSVAKFGHSAIPAIGIYDNSNALQATLWSGRDGVGSEDTWSSVTTGQLSLVGTTIINSSTRIKIRLNCALASYGPTTSVRWNNLTLILTYSGPAVYSIGHTFDTLVTSFFRAHLTDSYTLPYTFNLSHTISASLASGYARQHSTDAAITRGIALAHGTDSTVVQGGYVDYNWSEHNYASWRSLPFTIDEALYTPSKSNPNRQLQPLMNTNAGLHASFDAIQVTNTFGPLAFGWVLDNISWSSCGVPDHALVLGIQLWQADSLGNVTEFSNYNPTLQVFNINAHKTYVTTAISGFANNLTGHYNYPDTFANLYPSRGFPNLENQPGDTNIIDLYSNTYSVPPEIRGHDNSVGLTIECVLFPPTTTGLTSQALEPGQDIIVAQAVASVISYTLAGGRWLYVTTGTSAYNQRTGAVTVVSSSESGTVTLTSAGLVFDIKFTVTAKNAVDTAANQAKSAGIVHATGTITHIQDTQVGDWHLPVPNANPGLVQMDAGFITGIHAGKKWYGLGVPRITFTPDLTQGLTTITVHYDGSNLANHQREPLDFSIVAKGSYTPVLVPPPTVNRCVGMLQLALYNTGVDNNGNTLGEATPDPHYTIISSPVTTAPVAAYTVLDVPTIWAQVTGPNRIGVGGVLWITRITRRPFNGAYDPVNGLYVYRTTFTIPAGYDPATAGIYGLIDADDQVSVALNGVTVIPNTGASGLSINIVGPTYIGSPPAGSVLGTFKSGVNTLDFQVLNVAGVIEGLRTQISGDVCPAAPPPPPVITVIPGCIRGCIHPNVGIPVLTIHGTGVGDNDVVLDYGARDSHYFTGYTSGGVTQAPWVAASLTNAVAWRDANNHAAGEFNRPIATIDSSGYVNPGDYHYEVHFNTEGFDPGSISIGGAISAADAVAAIYLNGHGLPNVPTNPNGLSALSIPAGSGFQRGDNVLHFTTRVNALAQPHLGDGCLYHWQSTTNGSTVIAEPSYPAQSYITANSAIAHDLANNTLAFDITYNVITGPQREPDITGTIRVTGTITGVGSRWLPTTAQDGTPWSVPWGDAPSLTNCTVQYTSGKHNGKYLYRVDSAGSPAAGSAPGLNHLSPAMVGFTAYDGGTIVVKVSWPWVRMWNTNPTYSPVGDTKHNPGPADFYMVIGGSRTPRNWLLAALGIQGQPDWSYAGSQFTPFINAHGYLPTTGDGLGTLTPGGFDYGRLFDYARTLWFPRSGFDPNNTARDVTREDQAGFDSLLPATARGWLWDWLAWEYKTCCPPPPPPHREPVVPVYVTIPGFTASLTNFKLRIYYQLLAPTTPLEHHTDAWAAYTNVPYEIPHSTDTMLAYLHVQFPWYEYWDDNLRLSPDFTDSWQVRDQVTTLAPSSWDAHYLLRISNQDTWNTYDPAGTRAQDGWHVRQLLRLLQHDTWGIRRRLVRRTNDTWDDRLALQAELRDQWAVHQLIIQRLREAYSVWPASEYKPRPHYDLAPLADILDRRCAEPGFNTHRFVELIGGEIIEPTAYEPDPVTHRGMYYYNITTNRLYLKIYDRYEPEVGIVAAHWKGISD